MQNDFIFIAEEGGKFKDLPGEAYLHGTILEDSVFQVWQIKCYKYPQKSTDSLFHIPPEEIGS